MATQASAGSGSRAKKITGRIETLAKQANAEIAAVEQQLRAARGEEQDLSSALKSKQAAVTELATALERRRGEAQSLLDDFEALLAKAEPQEPQAPQASRRAGTAARSSGRGATLEVQQDAGRPRSQSAGRKSPTLSAGGNGNAAAQQPKRAARKKPSENEKQRIEQIAVELEKGPKTIAELAKVLGLTTTRIRQLIAVSGSRFTKVVGRRKTGQPVASYTLKQS